MIKRPYTTILLAAAFLVVGLLGIAAFGVAFLAWLRMAGTSPLATLFTLAWSGTFIATAILTWRRSHRAAPVFLAAMGCLLFLASSIVPGAKLFLLPLFGIILLFAVLGYRYLHRAGKPTA